MAESNENRAAALKAAQEALQAGDFAQGLARAQSLLDGDAGDAEALYIAAVACRYLSRYDEAQGLPRPIACRVTRIWPGLAGKRSSRPGAGRQQCRPCRLCPRLPLQPDARGELARASRAARRRRPSRPKPTRHGRKPGASRRCRSNWSPSGNHLYEGRLLRAEEICRHFLKKQPRNVEGMRLLAEIGSRFGVLDDAEFLLESAVAFDPDNVQLGSTIFRSCANGRSSNAHARRPRRFMRAIRKIRASSHSSPSRACRPGITTAPSPCSMRCCRRFPAIRRR